jgi:hypothetical protein
MDNINSSNPASVSLPNQILSPENRSVNLSVSTVKTTASSNLRTREIRPLIKNNEPFFDRQIFKVEVLVYKRSEAYQKLKSQIQNTTGEIHKSRPEGLSTELFMEVLQEEVKRRFVLKALTNGYWDLKLEDLVADVAKGCFGEDADYYKSWVDEICFGALKEKELFSSDFIKRKTLLHEAEVNRCVVHLRKGLDNVVILPKKGVIEKVQFWFSRFFSSKVVFDFDVFKDAIELLFVEGTGDEKKLALIATERVKSHFNQEQQRKLPKTQGVSKEIEELKGKAPLPMLLEAKKKKIPVPYVLFLTDKTFQRKIENKTHQINDIKQHERLLKNLKQEDLIEFVIAASCDPHSHAIQVFIAKVYDNDQLSSELKTALGTYGDKALEEALEAIDALKEGEVQDPQIFVKALEISPKPEWIVNVSKEAISIDLIKRLLAVSGKDPLLKSITLMLLVRADESVVKAFFKDLEQPKRIFISNLSLGKLPLEMMKQIYQGLLKEERSFLVKELEKVVTPSERVKKFLEWVKTVPQDEEDDISNVANLSDLGSSDPLEEASSSIEEYLSKLSESQKYSGLPLASEVGRLLAQGKLEEARALSLHVENERKRIKEGCSDQFSKAEQILKQFNNGSFLTLENSELKVQNINPYEFEPIKGAEEEKKVINYLVDLIQKFGGHAGTLEEYQRALSLLKTLGNLYSSPLIERAVVELKTVDQLEMVPNLELLDFLRVFGASPDPRVRLAFIENSQELKDTQVFNKNVNEIIVEFWDDFDEAEATNINKLFADFRFIQQQKKADIEPFRDKASFLKPFLSPNKEVSNPLPLAKDINHMTELLLAELSLQSFDETNQAVLNLIHFSENLKEFVQFAILNASETLKGNRIKFFTNLCEELQKTNNLYALKIVKEALFSTGLLSQEQRKELSRFSTIRIRDVREMVQLMKGVKQAQPVLKEGRVNGALIGVYTKEKQSFFPSSSVVDRSQTTYDLLPLLQGDWIDPKAKEWLKLKNSTQFPNLALFLNDLDVPNRKFNDVAKKMSVEEFGKVLEVLGQNDERVKALIKAIVEERDFLSDLPRFYTLLEQRGQVESLKEFMNQDKFIEGFYELGAFWMTPLAKFMSFESFKRLPKRLIPHPNLKTFVVHLADHAANDYTSQECMEILKTLNNSLKLTFAKTYLARTWDKKGEDPVKTYLSLFYGKEYVKMIQGFEKEAQI